MWSTHAVEKAVTAVPGVKGLHDLHIWSLSSNDLALSAHVEVDDAALSETTGLLAAVKDLLAREFGIGHATLELETEDGECAGSTCAAPPKNLGGKRRAGGHEPRGAPALAARRVRARWRHPERRSAPACRA